MITLENVSLQRNRKQILQPLSATLRPGTLTVLIGPNGAGKSSLLKLMAGTLRPDSGQVSCQGRPWADYPVAEQAALRAVLSQSLPIAFPMTVTELLETALPRQTRRQDARRRCQQALEEVELGHLASRKVQNLSGGELQRAHMARVLVQLWSSGHWPQQFCLLDEPTSALDLKHQIRLMQLARQLADEGLGVICVLHDLQLSANWADELWLLQSGALLCRGAPASVLSPARVRQAYGVDPVILPHPDSQRPMVIPPEASVRKPGSRGLPPLQ